MTRDLILEKNGPFSVSGGVLVPGDIYAYRIAIDMGTDTANMTAMAVCQENGEYSADYECVGTRIFVLLSGSMYASEGYITVRLAVSGDGAVLTAKEIIFRVVKPNNADTLAQTQSGTISQILTSVSNAENVSKNKMGFVTRVNDYDNLPSVKNNGDVCLIENAYSVPVYKRTLESISFYEIGMESESYAMLTLDSTDGIEAGNTFTVYDENLQIICSAAATSVSGNTLEIPQSAFYYKLMDMANQLTDDLYSEIPLNKTVYLTGSSFTGEGDSKIFYPSESCVVYADETWINLGGRIDLSDYATKDEVSNLADKTVIISNTMSKDEIVSTINNATEGTAFDIQTSLDLYDVNITFPEKSLVYSSTPNQKTIRFGYKDITLDDVLETRISWQLTFGAFSRIYDISVSFSDYAMPYVKVHFGKGCEVKNSEFSGYSPFLWDERCSFINCKLKGGYTWNLSTNGMYINCSFYYAEGIDFRNVYLENCSCFESEANPVNGIELLTKIKTFNPDMHMFIVDSGRHTIESLYVTDDNMKDYVDSAVGLAMEAEY